MSWGGSSGLKFKHPEWKLLRVKIENFEGDEFHFFGH